MCNLENPDFPESEDCFQPLTLADGSYYQQVLPDQFNITTQVQLPQDLICERCVLRWHYVAGKWLIIFKCCTKTTKSFMQEIIGDLVEMVFMQQVADHKKPSDHAPT